MDQFVIRGGKRVGGSIEVDISKNATLPIIAACILTDEEIVLEKIPNIIDVHKMLEILEWMGASVKIFGESAVICTSDISRPEIPSELAKEIRSSIFMLGPLLAKYKVARVAYPGGCDIGSRPIDLHLAGLKDLGVIMQEDYGFIDCDAKNMRSGMVHLDFPSVGATENIMMAAVLLDGETTILNAAKEPEIVDLANFINKIGGKIYG
ncbi:MAG: UDP-N-acetylglucosamine 1-carboxyvinyltransferase, partial [Clostridia bacterium]|nr:UDP-N-acetylglucosamine 1-carboxyvinyltransferase [Clostridia bacterium]